DVLGSRATLMEGSVAICRMLSGAGHPAPPKRGRQSAYIRRPLSQARGSRCHLPYLGIDRRIRQDLLTAANQQGRTRIAIARLRGATRTGQYDCSRPFTSQDQGFSSTHSFSSRGESTWVIVSMQVVAAIAASRSPSSSSSSSSSVCLVASLF